MYQSAFHDATVTIDDQIAEGDQVVDPVDGSRHSHGRADGDRPHRQGGDRQRHHHLAPRKREDRRGMGAPRRSGDARPARRGAAAGDGVALGRRAENEGPPTRRPFVVRRGTTQVGEAQADTCRTCRSEPMSASFSHPPVHAVPRCGASVAVAQEADARLRSESPSRLRAVPAPRRDRGPGLRDRGVPLVGTGPLRAVVRRPRTAGRDERRSQPTSRSTSSLDEPRRRRRDSDARARPRTRATKPLRVRHCEVAAFTERSAARSPIITDGACVLPDVTSGMTEASATLSPSTPRTPSCRLDDRQFVDSHLARADLVVVGDDVASDVTASSVPSRTAAPG